MRKEGRKEGRKEINFLFDKRIYNAKKTFFNYKIKMKIKTTTTGL